MRSPAVMVWPGRQRLPENAHEDLLKTRNGASQHAQIGQRRTHLWRGLSGNGWLDALPRLGAGKTLEAGGVLDMGEGLGAQVGQ